LHSEAYSAVRQSLADVGFYYLKDLLGTYAGRARDLHEWMAGAQINTDRNLRLSYLSGMSINSSEAAKIFAGICKYYRFPYSLFSDSDIKLESLNLNIINKMK
jgi:spermidine synthase